MENERKEEKEFCGGKKNKGKVRGGRAAYFGSELRDGKDRSGQRQVASAGSEYKNGPWLRCGYKQLLGQFGHCG